MALEKINVAQGTPFWLSLRRLWVTGTDFSVLSGCPPYAVRYKDQLLDVKKGREFIFLTEAMEMGSRYEPEARSAAEKDLGIRFKPAVYLDKEKYTLVSLDGIDISQKIVLEIKIPANSESSGDCFEAADDSELFYDVSKGNVPRYHFIQVQAQLWVTGAERAVFYIYDYVNKKSVWVDVFPCKKTFISLQKLSEEFYLQMLRPDAYCGDRPDVEYLVGDARINALAEEYFELSKSIKRLQSRLEEVKVSLGDFFSSPKMVSDVIKSTRSLNKGRVDFKSAAESNADIDLSMYAIQPPHTYQYEQAVIDSGMDFSGFVKEPKKPFTNRFYPLNKKEQEQIKNLKSKAG